jgi:nicotinate phosphoribosyltransferase
MNKNSSGTEIIRDVLETDVYNCSQINGVLALYPKTWAWYIFVDRGNEVYPHGFAGLVMEKFQDLRVLCSNPELRNFLREKWTFLADEFFSWLEKYRFIPEYIKMWQGSEGHLHGRVLGPWEDTIFCEQIIMAIVSQTRNEEMGYEPDDNWIDLVIADIKRLRDENMANSEFGMRRRAYTWMHDLVTEAFVAYGGDAYVGSSSPYHAKMSGKSPKGTVGHQWTMFHAAKYGVEHANQAALIAWRAVYGNNLGTALTDTLTSDFFWNTLTPGMARLIDSYRQDSGSPFEWTDHALRFFTDPNIYIDPSKITAMYTDSLDVDKAVAIHHYAKRWFKTAFGIGGFWVNNPAYFTNCPDYTSPKIVVKPYAFSFDEGTTWTKVAKVPDGVGKNIGDNEVIAEYQKTINKYPFKY